MKSKLSPKIKYKALILIIFVLILSVSINSPLYGSERTITNSNLDEAKKIQILIEDTELWYIEELNDIEYYTGVKLLFQDSTQDILDPASVRWKSDNIEVAEIKANGAIMPKSEGSTKITAEYKGLKDSVEITVKKGYIKKFYINQTNVNLKSTLHKKESQNPYLLNALIETSYGKKYDVTYNDSIQWVTGDEGVASVDCGHIYANTSGNVIISAKFKDLTAASHINISGVAIKNIQLEKEAIWY